ncbi:hypothetical protein ES705_26497 [subsurface metagenome]
MITALLETLLFTAIHGSWTFRSIMVNFSIWGLIWLISMFAYPVFFIDAQAEKLALSPYLSLLGYAIIVVMFIITYLLHKNVVEKRVGKKLSFPRILDLYFPLSKKK